MPKWVIFREIIVMQKFRQNASFSRKNNVKIEILQTNLQFDDFFRENNEFYYCSMWY